MEDIDGGLHPAVDGQSLAEDSDSDSDYWIQQGGRAWFKVKPMQTNHQKKERNGLRTKCAFAMRMVRVSLSVLLLDSSAYITTTCVV